MSRLLIGWSEISITPDKKVALWGQFAERISEYVEKPIVATEKAEAGGHYSAFISSGLVGHQGGEQLVRETLQSINRLFTEPVMINR